MNSLGWKLKAAELDPARRAAQCRAPRMNTRISSDDADGVEHVAEALEVR